MGVFTLRRVIAAVAVLDVAATIVVLLGRAHAANALVAAVLVVGSAALVGCALWLVLGPVARSMARVAPGRSGRRSPTGRRERLEATRQLLLQGASLVLAATSMPVTFLAVNAALHPAAPQMSHSPKGPVEQVADDARRLLAPVTTPTDRIAIIQDLVAAANQEPGTTTVSNPAMSAVLTFIRERSHEPGPAAGKGDLLYALRTVGALNPAFEQLRAWRNRWPVSASRTWT